MFNLEFQKIDRSKALPIVDCSIYVTPDQLQGKPDLTKLVIERSKQITDEKWKKLKEDKAKDKSNTNPIDGDSDEEFEDISSSEEMPRSFVFSLYFSLFLRIIINLLFLCKNKRKNNVCIFGFWCDC